MTVSDILNALLAVVNAMSPYLLLGFLIAGVLHVFVPKRFYVRYLSRVLFHNFATTKQREKCQALDRRLSHFPGCAEGPSCETEAFPKATKQ